MNCTFNSPNSICPKSCLKYWSFQGSKFLNNCSRIIKKYESHPSILKIREVYGGTDTLYFEHPTYENLYNEILLLNPSKAFPKDSIPPNVIKHHCDIFALKLHRF